MSWFHDSADRCSRAYLLRPKETGADSFGSRNVNGDTSQMTVIEKVDAATATKAGWFMDPTGQHKLRYFDGTEWTDHVTCYGPSPCTGCGHRAAD
jgi:hypothetical protein